MPELLDRFIDLNVRFEKISRKEKEVKHKKYIDFIIKESVAKLGDQTDYVVDGFVASIACAISYQQKFSQDHYNKLKLLTPFAILPPYKEYKKIIVNLQQNTAKVIKSFFSSIEINRKLLDPKYFSWCVEFIATLNGDIEFLMMYTKLFKK